MLYGFQRGLMGAIPAIRAHQKQPLLILLSVFTESRLRSRRPDPVLFGELERKARRGMLYGILHTPGQHRPPGSKPDLR